MATLSVAAAAGPDTSAWECRFCPFEEGRSGEVDLGPGYISDDAFKFGDHTGLHRDGLFLVGGADWRLRGADARYLDLRATNLGLDSRAVSLEGGRQGSYTLFANYRERPRLLLDTSRSPFRGAGTDTLTLPENWQRAGSTAGMTGLASALRDTDLRHRRRELGLGAAFIPRTRWESGVEYRRETRQGTARTGGAFVNLTSILPRPVDYTTDQIDARAAYHADAWQAQLAYYGSLFRNDAAALTWDNPFDSPASGTERGRLALDPDNEFHQIMVSAAAQPLAHTRLSANLALGRMTQDQSFVTATVNPELATALPRSSLDGRVNTTTANLRANTSVSPRLRLNAAYRYNDRDNRAPRDSYVQVVTDSFVSDPRTNLPYSFTDDVYRLGADLRLNRRASLAAGVEHHARERSFQDVARTRENTAWTRVRLRPAAQVELSLRVAEARRDGSTPQPVAGIQPPDNPLHRALHLADRDRSQADLRLAYTPRPGLSLGLGGGHVRDDFPESPLGVRALRNTNLTADVSYLLQEHWLLSGYASRARITSLQNGSQSGDAPDWISRVADVTDALGMGVERRQFKNRVDLAARYTYVHSGSDIAVAASAADDPFPELVSRLQRLDLSGTWPLRPQWQLRLGYVYERFNRRDWQVDGIVPDTVRNVLSLGEGSPRYDVHVIALTVRHSF